MPKIVKLRIRGDEQEIATFVATIQENFHVIAISQPVAYGDDEFYERFVDIVRAATVHIDNEAGEIKDL